MSIGAAELAHALGGRRIGGQYFAKCPCHADRSPSLAIQDGQAGTLVFCHAGCDSRDVLDELRHRGLWETPARRPSRRSPPAPRQITRPDDEAERRRRIAMARRIWSEARDPRGTLAEAYLTGRRLAIDDDLAGRALRFHAECRWDQS